MKIYTRTGDDGTTSLLGGERVRKDHQRIEAYGTVDELNCHLGMLADLATEDCQAILREIQSDLFHLGSLLASSGTPDPAWGIKEIGAAEVKRLEQQMDDWNEALPEMRNFILPGGHPAVSQSHICRTVCRRAERRLISFAGEGGIQEGLIEYLNRLSDFFFVLARWLSKKNNAEEISWIPSA